MVKITPNFNFNGKCKEAIQLYKEAFNAEIISLIRNCDAIIRRFLMHVPPKRFVRIRHYGLLCTRSKTKHLTLCRNLLGCKQYLSRLKDMEAPQMIETFYGINITVCKCCGGHLGKPQQRIHLRI